MNKIKRIVFDVDNTLIPWKEEYLKAVKKAATEFNLQDKYKEIDSVFLDYEKIYSSYNYDNLIELIYKRLNIKVTYEFINKWMNYLSLMSEEMTDTNETLKYLSQKYELVALTNFFEEVQVKRLEKARMHKYFKEVIGGDKYLKPSPKAFKASIGPYKPEECLMIGDNYEIDIKEAQKLGMKVIHLSRNEPIPDLKTIKNIKELKEIL